MKTVIRILFVSVVLIYGGSAYAVPGLQLDILGASYDNSTQTVIGGTTGTLYAYGKVGSVDLTQNYYISAAILPKVADGDADFGSFDFGPEGGALTTYNAANTAFGNPPLESLAILQGHDPGDLAHVGEIFPTAFAEISFMFDANDTRASVNVQDNAGTGLGENTGAADALYYVAFDYDASNLLGDSVVHFDLYSQDVACLIDQGKCNGIGDIDIDDFAPFSKDAQSNGDKCCTDLSEPGTLGLMMIGMIGAGATRIRRRPIRK